MKNNYALLFFLFIAYSTILYSQQVATLPNGDEVILREDGTWILKENIGETNINIGNNDCDFFIEEKTDKVTGSTSISGRESIIISEDGGANGIAILLVKSKKTVIITGLAKSSGSGCIDDDATINILFRDGTRLALSNYGDFNCQGKFTLYVGGGFGTKEQLESLSTKQIEIMRVSTSRSYVEENFSSESSIRFMKTFQCLANM